MSMAMNKPPRQMKNVHEKHMLSREFNFMFIDAAEASISTADPAIRQSIRRHARLNHISQNSRTRLLSPETLNATDPTLEPKFSFLNVTGEPSQASEDEMFRNRVRVHAAKHFNHPHGTSLIAREQIENSRVENAAFNKSSGLYRFPLASRKTIPRRRRKLDKEFSSSVETAQVNGSTVFADQLTENTNYEMNDHVAMIRISGSSITNSHSILSRQMIPAKLMPNHSGPAIQEFIPYILNLFVDNAETSLVNSTQSWISLAAQDPALLQASLSLAAIFYDTENSHLHHSNEAIRIVAERLNNSSDFISDTTIGAVALLAIHDSLTQIAGRITVHMDGLEQMVKARGGMVCLPHRLRRTLRQIDMLFGIICNHSLRFPLLNPYPTSIPIRARKLLPSYAVDALQRIRAFHYDSHDIILVLSMLSSVNPLIPTDAADRRAVMEIIYLVSYHIHAAQQGATRQISGPLCIAATLYLYLFVHRGPMSSSLGLAQELVESIVSAEQLALGHDLRTALWITVIGAYAAWLSGCETKGRIIGWLAWTIKARTQAEFESEICDILPRYRSFALQIAGLWNEICRLRM